MNSSPSLSLPVILTSPRSSASTQGEVRVESWDQKMRLRRALRSWGICWGMAIVTVFIPLLHFVLVPSLLLAGPVLAHWVYRQKTMILGGKGVCPSCAQPFEIVRSPLRWPINDVCSKCHDAVAITPVE